MEFDRGKPIYVQIADWIYGKILCGDWAEGERTPSVREVAVLLRVNPNTAMRAFEILQGEGVLFNRRGIGFFVEESARDKIRKRDREEFLQNELPCVFRRMERLGLTVGEMESEYDKFKNGKHH